MRLQIRHGETEIEVEATPNDVEIGPGDSMTIGTGVNDLVITNPLASLILEVVTPILSDIGISHPLMEVKDNG
jgi:hypothetical protein